jgi:uncharacterized protein (DUF2336 family)
MTTSRFSKLLALAGETSSEKRRELLRDVTDLFFETQSTQSEKETELFDEVLRSVAAEMQSDALIELADRLADTDQPHPAKLTRDLANNSQAAIAGRILQRCTSLTDEDLIRVLNRHGQEHARAIAQRATVSEPVSDAIVERGDDTTLDMLIRNDGARISRQSMEVVVDRAQQNPDLHAGVVGRGDMPIDLLNEMYFIVENRLRKAILTRNAAVDPAMVEAAVGRARKRMAKTVEENSAENRAARQFIERKAVHRELNGALLVSLLRDKMQTHFIYGLAEVTGLDFDAAHAIVSRKDFDALAMICRAADMERPLFVTMAVLICGADKAVQKAEEFGRLYASVPLEAAQRAMRFYKVRKTAPTTVAA